MNFNELLSNKSLKPKEKTEKLCKWALDNPKKVNELIEFAKISKDPAKATCIEALEFASKTNPEISSVGWLNFVTQTLTDKAPRIKWESAKVVGNIAHLYPNQL